jgi:hypothetical protein
MKSRSQSAAFFTTVLVGAIICLTGCATTGMDRSTKTTNSIQTVKAGMTQGEKKTGCTTGCDLEVRTKTGTGQ